MEILTELNLLNLFLDSFLFICVPVHTYMYLCVHNNNNKKKKTPVNILLQVTLKTCICTSVKLFIINLCLFCYIWVRSFSGRFVKQ